MCEDNEDKKDEDMYDQVAIFTQGKGTVVNDADGDGNESAEELYNAHDIDEKEQAMTMTADALADVEHAEEAADKDEQHDEKDDDEMYIIQEVTMDADEKVENDEDMYAEQAHTTKSDDFDQVATVEGEGEGIKLDADINLADVEDVENGLYDKDNKYYKTAGNTTNEKSCNETRTAKE